MLCHVVTKLNSSYAEDIPAAVLVDSSDNRVRRYPYGGDLKNSDGIKNFVSSFVNNELSMPEL